MHRTPVESSNLAAVGHDASVNILQVEFKNGSIYNYFKVTFAQYTGLMEAESVGKYLNANIKPHHSYELLEQGPVAELSTNQKQLDTDGIYVGVNRQALDEVMRDLHFLRFSFNAATDAYGDEPFHDYARKAYEEHYGWPAPQKYQPK